MKRYNGLNILIIILSIIMLYTITVYALPNNIQAIQEYTGPGLITNASFPAVENKLLEIPLGIPIGKEKLKKLKEKPFVPKGKQPKNEKDLSVINSVYPYLISEFDGMSNLDQTGGIKFIPPDPNIATGPNYVGTVVNSELAFYTKSGDMVKKTDLKAWFDNVWNFCSNCYAFDPRIIYDQVEGHWIILAGGMDFNNRISNSVYLISVSKTPDPTGDWWNYNLNGNINFNGPTWVDYPDIGYDLNGGDNGGAIYITSNQYGSGFTAALNILPKSELYSGNGFSYWTLVGFTNDDGLITDTLRPAKSLNFLQTNGNASEFLINSESGGGNSIMLWKVIPASPPNSPIISGQSISIGTYSPPPNALQLGCSNTLETLDNRLYNAVYRNGHIYTAFTDSYNWGSGTVSVIRYLDINTVSMNADQDTRYGSDSYYYYFPVITTDTHNNILFVFTRSNPSEYAGVHYTGKKVTDISAEPSTILQSGQECITGYRWGDYLGIANDPIDINKIWLYGEYAKKIGISSSYDWGTYIGQVSYLEDGQKVLGIVR